MAWTDAARKAALETRKRHEAQNRGGVDNSGKPSAPRVREIRSQIASLDSNLAGRTARVESRLLKKELAGKPRPDSVAMGKDLQRQTHGDSVKVMSADNGRHTEMTRSEASAQLKRLTTKMATAKMTTFQRHMLQGQINNFNYALKKGK